MMCASCANALKDLDVDTPDEILNRSEEVGLFASAH